MGKFLFYAVSVLAVTMLVRVESFPWDLTKMGETMTKMSKDAMDLANTGIQAMGNFKKEDIEELMTAVQKPEEREILMKVIVMMIQKKPTGEVADVLLDAECGLTLASLLGETVGKYKEFDAKYGSTFQDVIAKKGD